MPRRAGTGKARPLSVETISNAPSSTPEHTGRQTIDDDAVRRYFDRIPRSAAAAASYMAHERDLPPAMIRYRLALEMRTVEPWLAGLPRDSAALDLGCGAGAWAEIFADRFASVLAMDRSEPMIEAARARLAERSNVTVIMADARSVPEGEFGLIFLGGLCTYQSDSEAVALLSELAVRLAPGGAIVLRESTLRSGVAVSRGRYQAVYRSVPAYRALFRDAGFSDGQVAVLPNPGYTAMAVAGELVAARRRALPFLPAVSPLLGALTWWALRAVSPLSFRLVPYWLDRAGVAWPRLQNHFFRLSR